MATGSLIVITKDYSYLPPDLLSDTVTISGSGFWGQVSLYPQNTSQEEYH